MLFRSYWADYLQRDVLAKLLLDAGANPQLKKITVPASASYAMGEF